MKKLILLTLLLVCGITFVAAQKGAEIHFESKTHDFGDVSMSNPIFKCVFPFTNTGDEALFINNVKTSCHICMLSHGMKMAPRGALNLSYKDYEELKKYIEENF